MIPYARSENDQLVNIRDVPPGLACNCYCPACGSRLIARKGRRNIHHFAHYRKPECTYALESSLHLMAKSVLKKAGQIVLPPIFIHQRDTPIAYARLFQFGGIRLEVGLHDIVPDIILESAADTVLVEISVSHPSRQAKIWQLQQARLSAIEIDVKAIYEELAGLGKGTDLGAFRERIVEDIRHKKWLFNPKQHALENRLRSAADRKKVKRGIYRGIPQYTVVGCPLYKHFFRSGPGEGKSFAHVFRDCRDCPHCFEIEYRKKHVGYRHIATAPLFVYCTG